MMTARVLTAIDFAIRKHDGQWRKGDDGPPYVVHCIDVARRVAEASFEGDDTLCAAVLHDVVEDTTATFGEVEGLFGARVRTMVEELTLPEDAQRDYDKKLMLQVGVMVHTQFDAVRAIKIADKTSNILDLIKYPPKRWSPKSMLGYLNSAIKVVEAARTHTRSSSVRKMANMFSDHVGSVRAALEAKR